MARKPHTPASMRVRLAARAALTSIAASTVAAGGEDRPPLVLVALSGGADSLALAAAVAAEAPSLGVVAGAVIVDHGLQAGSAGVALQAATQARELGLDPVLVRVATVSAERSSVTGGPEAAARLGRYAALAAAATELGAGWLLTAHTRDDQAEQVLLALARGSGTRSLAGIPPRRTIAPGLRVLRPLLDPQLGVRRAVTEAACQELGLAPWRDPHNLDSAFLRVRVRTTVLPLLEQQLGPGFAAALARSADLAREDADALDALAEAQFVALARSEDAGGEDPRVSVPVAALAELPAALRGRVIRLVAARSFGAQLSREHTLAVAALVTAWKGQGPIHVPKILVSRETVLLVFRAR